VSEGGGGGLGRAGLTVQRGRGGVFWGGPRFPWVAAAPAAGLRRGGGGGSRGEWGWEAVATEVGARGVEGA